MHLGWSSTMNRKGWFPGGSRKVAKNVLLEPGLNREGEGVIDSQQWNSAPERPPTGRRHSLMMHSDSFMSAIRNASEVNLPPNAPPRDSGLLSNALWIVLRKDRFRGFRQSGRQPTSYHRTARGRRRRLSLRFGMGRGGEGWRGNLDLDLDWLWMVSGSRLLRRMRSGVQHSS